MSDERVYLWEQTRGKTDEEIVDFVYTLGGGQPAVFMELIMAILPLELDPQKASDCVIGFEITAQERVYAFRVEVSGTEVISERRDPSGADVTIAISLANFIRLITEELGGVKAFMQGKLWVRGNPTFAYSIPQMFPFLEKAALR